jgi:hypothetical protein
MALCFFSRAMFSALDVSCPLFFHHTIPFRDADFFAKFDTLLPFPSVLTYVNEFSDYKARNINHKITKLNRRKKQYIPVYR